MPMPNSASSINGSLRSRLGSISGTSAARSKVRLCSRTHSPSCSAEHRRSARSSSASAAGNSISSTPRMWSASGKGKAAAPYEFGVKASIVTNNRLAPGGLFVLHASVLPDNPYGGHTLRDVIDRTETLTGCAIERAYVDKGYRGHDAQNPRSVFISGVFGVIKRELRPRSAIKPIIGHLKTDGHLGRC